MSGPRYAIHPQFLSTYPNARPNQCYDVHSWNAANGTAVLTDSTGYLRLAVYTSHLYDCGMIRDNPVQKREPDPR